MLRGVRKVSGGEGGVRGVMELGGSVGTQWP